MGLAVCAIYHLQFGCHQYCALWPLTCLCSACTKLVHHIDYAQRVMAGGVVSLNSIWADPLLSFVCSCLHILLVL